MRYVVLKLWIIINFKGDLNMKRTVLLLVLALAAGGTFAHEKGDLILNIEPQLGTALPPDLAPDHMNPGFDVGLRTTVHYFLTVFFSFNTGLGVGFNYHKFSMTTTNAMLALVPIIGWIVLAYDGFKIETTNYGDFFAPYVTVPLGFRFSPNTFVLGAGTTINIPIHGNESEGNYMMGKLYLATPHLLRSIHYSIWAGILILVLIN